MGRTPGENHGVKQKFVLTPSATPPIHSTLYCADLQEEELKRKEIARIAEASVAEAAVRERASHILFVPKNDKSLRFCVDYHRLNAVTERNGYPILQMHKYIFS